jgi:hypothetical protein
VPTTKAHLYKAIRVEIGLTRRGIRSETAHRFLSGCQRSADPCR